MVLTVRQLLGLEEVNPNFRTMDAKGVLRTDRMPGSDITLSGFLVKPTIGTRSRQASPN